jgi:vacuolar-type H+-ATPase subunit H
VAQLDPQLPAMPADITADPDAPRRARPGMPPVRPLPQHGQVPMLITTCELAQVVILVQEKADQLTDETRAKADQILRQVRSDCQHLPTTAQDEAEDVISEAGAQVKTILQEAQTTAQGLQQQSQDKAALHGMVPARGQLSTAM